MAAEYEIYNDENGHFHSGGYAGKAAAEAHAKTLSAVGGSFSVRKTGAPALEVETTETPGDPEQEG